MSSNPVAALGLLLQSASVQDHEEAVRLANAALQSGTSDIRLHQTRLVALLKLDRFEDALRAVSDGGDGIRKACAFELAYALYKTGKLQEAADILETSDGVASRKTRHLAAQIAYRAERFDVAMETYDYLLQGTDSDGSEEIDLKINALAAEAQVEWQGRTRSSVATPQPETFELAYNLACGAIARGDYAGAATLLQRATILCNLSEDLSEEDKKTEMVPLVAQRAVALAKLEQLEKAKELLDSISLSDIPDAETMSIVALNQSLSASIKKNPFLLQRTVDSKLSSKGDKTLFGFQRALKLRNKFVVDLEAKKYAGVEFGIGKVLAALDHPSTSAEWANLSALQVAAHDGGATGKAATRSVLGLLEKRLDDVGLVVTTIQHLVDTTNLGAATSVLESFLKRQDASPNPKARDVRYSSGVVALAVELYKAQGRLSAAKSELAKAAAYWTQQRQGERTATALLREAGLSLLKTLSSADVETAGAAFATLLEYGSQDPVATAGSVAAFALRSRSKIEEQLCRLPSVETLTAGIDPIGLVQDGLATSSATGAEKRKRPADAGAVDKPAKKRRNRKLPKDYEEGKNMDPERWLPLRDRSSYRPKGKKGKKIANQATQGGVVKEEETLELVGGAGAVKVEKAPAVGSSSKKKKKGKR